MSFYQKVSNIKIIKDKEELSKGKRKNNRSNESNKKIKKEKTNNEKMKEFKNNNNKEINESSEEKEYFNKSIQNDSFINHKIYKNSNCISEGIIKFSKAKSNQSAYHNYEKKKSSINKIKDIIISNKINNKINNVKSKNSILNNKCNKKSILIVISKYLQILKFLILYSFILYF